MIRENRFARITLRIARATKSYTALIVEEVICVMRVYLWCLYDITERQLHNNNARGINIQLRAHQLHINNCWGINCVIIPAPMVLRTRSTTTRDRSLCNFGAPSPLEALHWIFCFFSSIYVQFRKTSPLKSGESREKSSGENPSNPVTSVAVMVFSALNYRPPLIVELSVEGLGPLIVRVPGWP